LTGRGDAIPVNSRDGTAERVVDVMEELVTFTLLTRDVAPHLVDRYSERRESAEELSKRVNQRSI
jgi:arsenical resistance protein ArsH